VNAPITIQEGDIIIRFRPQERAGRTSDLRRALRLGVASNVLKKACSEYAAVRVLGAVASVLIGLAVNLFVVWCLLWLAGVPVEGS
jgi:hypothetical protein